MRLPLLLLVACSATETVEEPAPPISAEVLDRLDATRLKAHVDILADDDMGGRLPGSAGHLAALDYIRAQLEDIGVEPMGIDGFDHSYPTSPRDDRLMLDETGAIVPQQVDRGVNLVAGVRGADDVLANEYILVMAHYDHLGVDEDGDVFNGAFDNATGVAATLELARLFVEGHVTTNRSIIFMITDEEEAGLQGAEEWLDDPATPLGEIIAGISVDPVGRGHLPDFWPLVLMGTERSPEFDQVWRDVAQWSAPELPIHFIHRNIVPVFASDQDNLYQLETPIPGVWFVNPGMSFYHTPDDAADTIDYRVLLHTTRFLAMAVKALGDDDTRYAYEGEPRLGATHARDAMNLFEGAQASSVITLSEQDRLGGFIAEMRQVEQADDVNALTDDPSLFFFQAAYYMLFELPVKYPGEVPPPFPP